jgi:competence protein CoiA
MFARVHDADKLNLSLDFADGALQMMIALVGGQRVEAHAGGRGFCPFCNGEVIAKCGTYRVSHWAHRAIRDCDSWAEGETDWHRAWKNKFPAECREFIQHDRQSGEKHIADVRTHHGLVIEFQRSPLDPLERVKRERFHGNMVWVVDGSRLQRDWLRFNEGKDDLRPTIIKGCFLLASPEKCFPAKWLDSSVPVIFDFRGVDELQQPNEYRDTLWCLLPGRAAGSAWIVGMLREQFVGVALSCSQLPVVQEILAFMTDIRAAEALELRRFAEIPGGRRPRRRYARF